MEAELRCMPAQTGQIAPNAQPCLAIPPSGSTRGASRFTFAEYLYCLRLISTIIRLCQRKGAGLWPTSNYTLDRDVVVNPPRNRITSWFDHPEVVRLFGLGWK